MIIMQPLASPEFPNRWLTFDLMIWRLKVCQQLRQSKRLQLLNISCCPSLLHIISYLFLTFPMLLAVVSSAFPPALALITASESIQLLGREQSTFILSGYVFCHINELRGLEKGSNKNQIPCTTKRNCMARTRMVVVKTASFRICVRLDLLTLWNPASASHNQFIQSCPLWGQRECSYWFLRKAVAKESNAFGPQRNLCFSSALLSTCYVTIGLQFSCSRPTSISVKEKATGITFSQEVSQR